MISKLDDSYSLKYIKLRHYIELKNYLFKTQAKKFILLY